MYKSRIISFFLIVLILLPFGALPVKANTDVSGFSRLAGNSAPVLTAITECAIGKLLDNAQKYSDEALNEASASLMAQTYDGAASQSLEDVQSEAKRLKNERLCTIPIERAAAQTILQTLTQETVNWINTGMNGKPMFEQDAAAAFKKMQNQKINEFKSELQNNPDLYPFGKDILNSNITDMRSTFQSKAKSSLGDVLSNIDPSFTMETFGNDFKSGGWDAFSSSLDPSNNPVGFNFLTQDNLNQAVSLTGKDYTPAQALKDQLAWGNGFLSQTKCLDPGWAPSYDDATEDPPCSKTQIVTPGSIIQDELSKTLGSGVDALNLGNNLDAGLTSIFNAMLTKLLQTGLASVTDDSGSSNSNTTTTKLTVAGNATPGSLCGVQSSTDWYKQYPNFNFAGDDLNKLVSREDQLKKILLEQNGVAKKILDSIYALDYCVPGPHPFTVKSVAGSAFGTILGKMPSSTGDRGINAQFLNDKLGIHAFPDYRIQSLTQVSKIVKEVTTRYFTAVQYQYHNRGADGSKPVVDDLIPSAADDAKYYPKIRYYEQVIADNEAKINIIISTKGQLSNLSRQLSNLQTEDAANGKDLHTDPRYINLQTSFNVLVPELDVSPYSSSASKRK